MAKGMTYEEFLELCESTNKRSSGELVARIIIDTEKWVIHYVPANINHLPYICKYILKILEKEVEKNPTLATHFVSVVIHFKEDMILEMLTGVSGLETGLKLFKDPVHTKAQVNGARDFMVDYLVEIKAKFAPNWRNNVVYL